MSAGPSRWAVYWTPEEDHPLWEAGCRWLGRDPRVDDAEAPPPGRAAPWRYGFHATLKPPLILRPGLRAEDFIDAVGELASSSRAASLPALSVAMLEGFIALRPIEELAEEHPLHRLAARCVVGLDAWRAPAPTRSPAGQLDARQQQLLARWDYPHVLDRWRFHLTLSDSLDARPDESQTLLARARRHFAAALALPLRMQSICVFEEVQRDAPLRLRVRMALRR